MIFTTHISAKVYIKFHPEYIYIEILGKLLRRKIQ